MPAPAPSCAICQTPFHRLPRSPQWPELCWICALLKRANEREAREARELLREDDQPPE